MNATLAQHMGTYLLVLLAVSLFIYVAIRLIQSFSNVRIENASGSRQSR